MYREITGGVACLGAGSQGDVETASAMLHVHAIVCVSFVDSVHLWSTVKVIH